MSAASISPAPIRSLPDALVSLVFTFVFSARRLLACSLVCRDWRCVLSSPTFWKRISLMQSKLSIRDKYTHILLTLKIGKHIEFPLLLYKPLYDLNAHYASWHVCKPDQWDSWIENELEVAYVVVRLLDVNENLYTLAECCDINNISRELQCDCYLCEFDEGRAYLEDERNHGRSPRYESPTLKFKMQATTSWLEIDMIDDEIRCHDGEDIWDVFCKMASAREPCISLRSAHLNLKYSLDAN